MVSVGCHERAVDAYTEAYRHSHPETQFEILKCRAYAKHCMSDCIGAINDLTDMIALQPDNPQYYTCRSITRRETADYRGAIDNLDKAAEITGFDAELHNQSAHAHMHAAFAQLNYDTETARKLAEEPSGFSAAS